MRIKIVVEFFNRFCAHFAVNVFCLNKMVRGEWWREVIGFGYNNDPEFKDVVTLIFAQKIEPGQDQSIWRDPKIPHKIFYVHPKTYALASQPDDKSAVDS